MKSGREYLPLFCYGGDPPQAKNPAKQDSFCAVEKAWKKKTVRFAIMTNSAQGRYYNHSHTGNV